MIKTAQDLEQHLSSQAAEIEILKDKIRTITVAVKNSGDWHHADSKDGMWYRAGQCLWHAIKGRKSDPSRVAEKIAQYGAIPMATNSGTEYDRAEKVMRTKAGLSASPLTADDSVGSYGGSYLLAPEYSSEVARIAEDASGMMGLVRRVPQNSRLMYWPTSTTTPTITKVTDENTDKTETSLTFGQKTLTTYTYAGWIAISEEIGEDNIIGLVQYTSQVFGEAWGLQFDEEVLNSAANPTGIFQDGTVNLYTMMETGFGDIAIVDFDSMIGKLTTKTKRVGAAFVMHETVWDYIQNWVDTEGRAMLTKYVGDVAPKRLRGYPVHTSDAAPEATDSAANTAFVAFGNFKHFLWGDRIGMQFEVFDKTQSTMESDQVFLRFRTRASFVNAIPSAFCVMQTAAS